MSNKCVLCGIGIKIYEYDLQQAFVGINPETFRKARMHSDCYRVALDTAEETESKDPQKYQNRLDEYQMKYPDGL